MSALTGLIVFMVVFCFLAIFAVVGIFVLIGAKRISERKKELATVNVFDGVSKEEMQIIANVILRKKQADQESKVRTDAVEALKP